MNVSQAQMMEIIKDIKDEYTFPAENNAFDAGYEEAMDDLQYAVKLGKEAVLHAINSWIAGTVTDDGDMGYQEAIREFAQRCSDVTAEENYFSFDV